MMAFADSTTEWNPPRSGPELTSYLTLLNEPLHIGARLSARLSAHRDHDERPFREFISTQNSDHIGTPRLSPPHPVHVVRSIPCEDSIHKFFECWMAMRRARFRCTSDQDINSQDPTYGELVPIPHRLISSIHIGPIQVAIGPRLEAFRAATRLVTSRMPRSEITHCV